MTSASERPWANPLGVNKSRNAAGMSNLAKMDRIGNLLWGEWCMR
jgi:hypothetical protein